MDSPELMTWEDVLNLENLEKEHPYFQTIKSLIAKHYLDHDHILKTKKVNTASIYSLDRNSLRTFLNITKKTSVIEKTKTEEAIPEKVIQEKEVTEKVKFEEVEEQEIEKQKVVQVNEPTIELKEKEPEISETVEVTNTKEVIEFTSKEEEKAAPIVEEKVAVPEIEEPKPLSKKEQDRKNLLDAINARLDQLKDQKEAQLKVKRDELAQIETDKKKAVKIKKIKVEFPLFI